MPVCVALLGGSGSGSGLWAWRFIMVLTLISLTSNPKVLTLTAKSPPRASFGGDRSGVTLITF